MSIDINIELLISFQKLSLYGNKGHEMCSALVVLNFHEYTPYSRCITTMYVYPPLQLWKCV